MTVAAVLRAPLLLVASWLSCGAACRHATQAGTGPDAAAARAPSSNRGARLPLVVVADVPWPGRPTRFDYQEIDPAQDHLVVAHMNDGAVVIADLRDGAALKEVPGIPLVRGIAVADEAGLLFATSMPNQLVLIDDKTFAVVARVTVGRGPDGVAWDPVHRVVGVSDQRDGALSLVADSGRGTRTAVSLGSETGNVVFDKARGVFWITVVKTWGPDQLMAVQPTTAHVVTSLDLPGCSGAHGLRLHPDGQSAFIACESNDVLARVDLEGTHAVVTGPTGRDPDVLSLDPGLGWLYVAAESGDLTVYDITQPGIALVGHDSPGNDAHSVAVDPATHRVFFPLPAGRQGTPVLRILRPSGVP